MAKGEALKSALESLRSAIPELKGVLLASNEGLPIAHALTNGADPNRVAAMAAAARIDAVELALCRKGFSTKVVVAEASR